MEPEYIVRSSHTEVSPVVEPDQAKADLLEARLSLQRGAPDTDNSSSKNDDIFDDPVYLDALYIDIIFNLELLLKNGENRPALQRSEVAAPLQAILIDLRVWAYDLSDESAPILEYFRSLPTHNHELQARLQRNLGEINRVLVSIKNEVEQDKKGRQGSDTHGSLLHQCQRMKDVIQDLKSLKPLLRDKMSTWKDEIPVSAADSSESSSAAVLVFDGGGFKSYSSLLLLKALMGYIDEEISHNSSNSSRATNRKPCEVFDFMFGSSSGGLIAIMLGRLEMTVEECIENFCAYADAVFASPKRRIRKLLRPWSAPKYDADKITEATRRLVDAFDPMPDDEKWRRNVYGTPQGRCKTGVLATIVSPNYAPHMFRTYDYDKLLKSKRTKALNSERASTHQIWEVARATSAAPSFFDPIHLEDKVFFDGGLMTNNPAQEALREVAGLRGDLSGVCVVSIGSGISDEPLLPKWPLHGKGASLPSPSIVRLLRKALTQTELTHSNIQREASLNASFSYFRLNTTYKRLINLDEWDATGQTRSQMKLSTEEFLESEDAKVQMRLCASAIAVKISGGNRYYVENMHYLVPQPPNSLFTGRTDEMHLIRELLTSNENNQDDSPRILVVTGMGGQGKSEICLKLAHDMREEFWGIFWVDFSTSSLAEIDFLRIAKVLGSAVNEVQEALRVIATVGHKWLLVLDNADDPNTNYQQYFPGGSMGTVIITSRMRDCGIYSTIGSVTVNNLSRQESIELLLKSSGIRQKQSSSLTQQAEKIVNVLGSHPLAINEAGAFIAAGYSSLAQYAELPQQHLQRMLQHKPRQAKLRYGNLYDSWEISIARLDESKHGSDALFLLNVLSMLHFSPVPIQLFEDTWKTLSRLQEYETPNISSVSISPFQWHPSDLSDFMGIAQITRSSGLKEWDSLRFIEASSLLASFALVDRNDLGLCMHPVVHAWAKSRQSSSMRNKFWLITGCIIALSSQESSTWLLHQLELRPHLQSFLDVDIPVASDYDSEEVILEILWQCGHLLSHMGDKPNLSELLDRVFSRLKADSDSPSSRLLLLRFFELSARNLVDQGKYVEAERLSRQVLEGREKILGSDDPGSITALNNLASVCQIQGKLEEAERLGQRVLDLRETALGPDHPDILRAFNNLTIIYEGQGKLIEAEQLGQRVLLSSERVLGSEHLDTLRALNKLASVYWARGKLFEAETLDKRATGALMKILGPDHPDTLTALENLALVYRDQGKFVEAERLSRQVLDERKRISGLDHPVTLRALSNLASVYQARGDYRNAEWSYRQTIRLGEKVLGEDHPATLDSICGLAKVLFEQNQYQEAKELLRRAYDGFKAQLGDDHPATKACSEELSTTIESMSLQLRESDTNKSASGRPEGE